MLLHLLTLALLISLASTQEEGEEELESGLLDLIISFGESLYGSPNNSTGEKVSGWNEKSGLNPEELGEYAEGDILFPSSAKPKSRNGITGLASRWSRGIVPYVMSGYFTSEDNDMIYRAFEQYHKKTCVRFVQRTTESDYIVIKSGNTGCWSSVGRIGGPQDVNLQTPGCTSQLGTVIHELMHAVGFLHEQNRWERDDYVTIAFQNIQSGRENNFEKAKRGTTDGQGIGYDYSSVMHYSNNAFSTNGQPTIIPKNSGVGELGQRNGFSQMDVKKIRRMYKCKNGKSGIK